MKYKGKGRRKREENGGRKWRKKIKMSQKESIKYVRNTPIICQMKIDEFM